jgi:uncharacterized protein DUF937
MLFRIMLERAGQIFAGASIEQRATEPIRRSGNVQTIPPCDLSGEIAMAINLISVVTQFLTPEVIGQIASLLGIDRSVAQKATGAAVPTMLAGLADLVETPAGAGQLSKLMSQQQGSPMDLLRNSGAQGLAQTGSTMLAGLFGNKSLDTMAQMLGKFAGLNDIGGKSLLGMIGPLVLGALGQHQREAGLDSNGLVSLLRSQKDQIVSAIPSGLANQLDSAGLIDTAESGMRTAAATGGRIAGAASEGVASGARRAATAATDKAQWPYWLAALAVVAGLAWYAFGRTGPETVAEAPAPRPAAGTVGMAPAALTVDGVNLTNQFNSSINTLKAVLPTIANEADAQTALPKINDAVAQLNDTATRATKLSPDARSALAKLVAAATPAIDQMCDKILATSAGPVAKPAIDNLRAKLDALAKA